MLLDVLIFPAQKKNQDEEGKEKKKLDFYLFFKSSAFIAGRKTNDINAPMKKMEEEEERKIGRIKRKRK